MNQEDTKSDVLPTLEWAVERWYAEVSNRPLVNTHRRALDDTWRQVIRHSGGDDIALLGPTHDQLVADQMEKRQAGKPDMLNKGDTEEVLHFSYTNHRGETAPRRVMPHRLYFGTSPLHTEPVWLMSSYCFDRQAHRTFELTKMIFDHG